MKYCANCNVRYSDKNRCCNDCGSLLDALTDEIENKLDAKDNKTKKIKRIKKTVSISIISVAILTSLMIIFLPPIKDKIIINRIVKSNNSIANKKSNIYNFTIRSSENKIRANGHFSVFETKYYKACFLDNGIIENVIAVTTIKSDNLELFSEKNLYAILYDSKGNVTDKILFDTGIIKITYYYFGVNSYQLYLTAQEDLSKYKYITIGYLDEELNDGHNSFTCKIKGPYEDNKI